MMKRTSIPMLLVAITILTGTLDGDEESEFKSLFNGTDLTGWDGDERFWRVEDGVIVGQTTAENKAAKNTFLIYRGSEFGDFELRFKYKVEGYNSGMQYRSVDKGNFVLNGMQADFEARWHKDANRPDAAPTDTFTGMYFEEGGRMFMGQRGDAVNVHSNPDNPKKPHIEKIGSTGDPTDLEQVIRRDDWNDYTIIASGRLSVHIINGRVMSLGHDEDDLNFRPKGLIGLQLHSGPPMRIDVKDITIRELR